MAMTVEDKQLGLAIVGPYPETSGPTSYLNRPKRPRLSQELLERHSD